MEKILFKEKNLLGDGDSIMYYAKGNSIIRRKFDYEKGVSTRKSKAYYEKENRLGKISSIVRKNLL